VAPALLEELLGEIGSLASAYHKPAETFIGHGRVGADSLRKGEELVDDQFSTQKALQTVVAGRQAENLLDFDDDNTMMEGQPSGLAATQVFSETPAAAKLLAGTSSNPLDDLVSIFGGSGGGGGVPMSATTNLGFGTFGGTGVGFGGMPLSPMPPPTLNPALPPKPSSQQPQPQHQQDDLLGLF